MYLLTVKHAQFLSYRTEINNWMNLFTSNLYKSKNFFFWNYDFQFIKKNLEIVMK